MTEHSFDYMAKDECSQWAATDHTCCPEGTHKRDCGITKGHNAERNSHAFKHPNLIDFIALVIALSGVAYAVLSRVLA